MNSAKSALDHEPPPVAAPEATSGPPVKKLRDRPNLIVVAAPVLIVLVTFLFWYSTWFGRPLGDGEMAESLTDISMPHRTQHALAQVADEIARGNPAARRWYPDVLRLAASKEAQFRLMAAWVMGQDVQSDDFHRALLVLARDPEPMVRGNAALALVRFGDASSESELRLLLRPFTIVTPQAGRLTYRLKLGDPVSSGGAVARIKPAAPAARDGGGAVDVVSPLDGHFERQRAQEGTEVAAGAAVAAVSPGEQQVWEALRALYLVGRREDLADVERYAGGAAGMSARVRQQAILTAQAIRQRAATSDR